MKKISVITSFNEKYYELIGKYCVATFLKNWPADINLTCYVEEMSLTPDPRIIQIPFTELPVEYFDLQKTKFKQKLLRNVKPCLKADIRKTRNPIRFVFVRSNRFVFVHS